uniref:Uncharacterized protein n=1 Tax=Melopsittacus undulatus TaxID=13146 RepID=A0A8C6JS72_MELUD
MHWSPEHAQSLNQWPEQHLDVSSTTSSPAHKPDLYPSTRQRFNYAWANDDISALTASNLLKRYAEKYSGVLDVPYDSAAVEEQPKNIDPLVLELVNTKIVERGPPVQWTDIAGQVSVKATIEEELVWPILRPGAYTGAGRPPRTILLFGPRGTGKTLLSRCISTQLGSTLLKLSGTALLSTWKAEAEQILQTVFFVASCRQPAVVLITEAEALLLARAGEDVSGLKSQLLSYLDDVSTSSEQNVVVIGTTARPGSMDEASHRRFAKRFYICPPDSIARRQILHHTLGQLQPPSYQDLEKLFCKVRPAASQKELDLFLEWDKLYGTRHWDRLEGLHWGQGRLWFCITKPHPDSFGLGLFLSSVFRRPLNSG